ncbi:hypothetical protein Val02_42530 [Virgisporangium aliadipatigenens]|uniref:Uncharacterized protein n=1 Tax=Virgisporangium aliadipatigenens TaxID=741659 RepID=A0A8J4DSL9_9ACTN|nr:hypothetical protein Val02_42530 [Virgisporangium aliadipatigenens]
MARLRRSGRGGERLVGPVFRVPVSLVPAVLGVRGPADPAHLVCRRVPWCRVFPHGLPWWTGPLSGGPRWRLPVRRSVPGSRSGWPVSKGPVVLVGRGVLVDLGHPVGPEFPVPGCPVRRPSVGPAAAMGPDSVVLRPGPAPVQVVGPPVELGAPGAVRPLVAVRALRRQVSAEVSVAPGAVLPPLVVLPGRRGPVMQVLPAGSVLPPVATGALRGRVPVVLLVLVLLPVEPRGLRGPVSAVLRVGRVGCRSVPPGRESAVPAACPAARARRAGRASVPVRDLPVPARAVAPVA